MVVRLFNPLLFTPCFFTLRFFTLRLSNTCYLPMLPMYRSTEPQPGRQHTQPPHSAAASLSTRQAKRELELGET